MDSVAALFAVIFLASGVLAVVSFFKPGAAFFLREKTRQKSILSYLGIALLSFAGGIAFAPSTPTQGERSLPGQPLPYAIVEQKEEVRAAIGRNRLYASIIPQVDQSAATQADLISTVMEAAIALQKKSGLPIVSVKMIAQSTGNPYSERLLASAVYIPDSKGYNGEQKIGPWDTLRAARRGFTALELEYFRLWGTLLDNFTRSDGTLDEDSLTKAIYERMGIEPGSISPHGNIAWAYDF